MSDRTSAPAGSLLAEMNFKGRWRDYQARALEEIDRHIGDKRLHVVAAPGSGKTVLGLEIIRRFGRPALVLSPTRTIRDQWCERLQPLFVDDLKRWNHAVSHSLNDPRELTCITYQALHACWKDAGDGSAPAGLASAVAQLGNRGPVTLVVDECHHLRREWWNALFELRKELPDSALVALTATPPYDAPYAEWMRYERLCGQTDLEISVPELVRNGDLCPHQDHVHLSQPRHAEFELVQQRRKAIAGIAQQLLADPQWAAWTEAHPWMVSPREFEAEILENPQLLSAMLVFLHAGGRPLPLPPLELLAATGEEVPPFTPYWLQVLLQGIMDTPKSHQQATEGRRALKRQLHRSGLITNEKVRLQEDIRISRAMAGSIAKLDSIAAIADAEAANLGEGLRMVILTDHVRASDLPVRPDSPFYPPKLGVIPIFEVLRRAGPAGQPLGALTGTMTIVPEACRDILRELAREAGVADDHLVLSPLDPCPGYLKLDVSGESDRSKVALVTQLFNRGHIRILAGTQALLGEGWDAPTINSLVLASNAGSFVLSNQMRGRAIRIDPARPDKVSNIWHLATVYPSFDLATVEGFLPDGATDAARAGGEDMDLLERRFETFEGIANSGNPLIENGLARLALTLDGDIGETNRRTLELAARRDGIAERWRASLGDATKRGHVQKVAEASYAPRLLGWHDTIQYLVLSGIGSGVMGAGGALQDVSEVVELRNLGILLMVFAGLTLLYSLPKLSRAAWLIFKTGTLERGLGQVGNVLVECLCHAGVFRKPVEEYPVVVIPSLLGRYAVGVQNVTRAEERIFLEALAELLGPPENPRYLLLRRSRLAGKDRTDYHAVPGVLGAHKDRAEHFLRIWRARIGPSDLVYTRTNEGRLLLLRARAMSFSALIRRPVDRRSMWV